MAETYTVQAGDTLHTIARRFGVDVESLVRDNNIANPDAISPGQVLTITTGANQPAAAARPGANQRSRRVDGLLYTIYTDRPVYRRGENVQITLIKTNVSGRRITLRYRTAQRFDFVARRAPGQPEIWRWSRGRLFAQVTEVVVLRPGESRIYRAVWDQRSNRGQLVAPGTIIIEGFNVAEGLAGQAVSTTIGIRTAVEPVPPVTPPCPDVNILVNPGFENWPDPLSPPPGWSGRNLFRSTVSRTGRFAAGFGAISNERAVLAQRREIEPGRIYNLSWWARETIRTGGIGRFVLFVEIFYYDRAGAFVGRTEPRYTQDDIPEARYQNYSLSTGRVPAGARTAEVRFTLEPSGANNNVVNIDDVDLRCRF